ncbi:GNAT family N-acetyltransferase [Sporosarcina sp. P37]|uniref:GNAT family N-acetyltransferase n=1 Tax=unclassified Sporosarcina TaxID=2647733 RepID=UPI0009C10A57|nr:MULTISPECIES: GNAT family N-acetyltransferase [unclassified Sporosarcina]ARD46985.1 GNAT family acetyltransferase [Sporosarcina sp. P33]ARK23510.1 GNAT family N-acetyltransferase [Sporosarcina sp. P37]PID17665.1 N-acetyltransferase [Sporosarcina sp. P35]
MNITAAKITDAPVIHDVMIRAFRQYEHAVPPTSALKETVESITAAMEGGEQALIGYIDEEPVAMIRFRLEEDSLYFFRFSVVPEKQGQGIAKKILQFIEDYAKQQEKKILTCKVRADVAKNISLYQSVGFHAYDQAVLHRADGTSMAVVLMKKSLT